jgi:hypothetical protein
VSVSEILVALLLLLFHCIPSLRSLSSLLLFLVF